MIQNGKLLITGGTGSFGNAVLNRFLNTNYFSEIRIFSRDEKKQDDLRKRVNNSKVNFYIGDVRDRESLIPAIKNVDYIFHAAALKQVPSCEFFPLEAVKTNILGTDNVLSIAQDYEVKKVVVLSTDKAAYPINAMGMSKALMEKIMIAKSKNISFNDTILSATRYGNVMASRGSVIPLFTDLIKKNREILITDPEMTRFMMSLPQAVELVMFAFINSSQGDTFIQKAPGATIMTLVEALGIIFEKKIKYKIIGTRHGEKKHEALLSREEFIKAQDMGNYYRIPADNRDLNYSKYFDYGEKDLSTMQDYTSENTRRLDKHELVEILLKLDYIKEQIK